MTIRPYTPKDKSAILNLLALNTPDYFDPSEQKDLIHYLDQEIEDYFVIEEFNEIIGSGGINYFPSERLARIAWDFVNPSQQGKGVGSLLTKHRLTHLNSNSEIDTIIVRTSQLVYKFYEKMNFNLNTVTPDYWAPGYDLYEMEQANSNFK